MRGKKHFYDANARVVSEGASKERALRRR